MEYYQIFGYIGAISVLIAIILFFIPSEKIPKSTKICILIIGAILVFFAIREDSINKSSAPTSTPSQTQVLIAAATPTTISTNTPTSTQTSTHTLTPTPTPTEIQKVSIETANQNKASNTDEDYDDLFEGYLETIPDEAPDGYYIVVEYHFPGKSDITTRFIDYVKPDIDYSKADGYWWFDSRYTTTRITNELFLDKYGDDAILIDNIGVD